MHRQNSGGEGSHPGHRQMAENACISSGFYQTNAYDAWRQEATTCASAPEHAGRIARHRARRRHKMRSTPRYRFSVHRVRIYSQMSGFVRVASRFPPGCLLFREPPEILRGTFCTLLRKSISASAYASMPRYKPFWSSPKSTVLEAPENGRCSQSVERVAMETDPMSTITDVSGELSEIHSREGSRFVRLQAISE